MIRTQSPALPPVVALARPAVAHELDRRDHAGLADLGNLRMICERGRRFGETGGKDAIARDHVVVAKDSERRERGGAGEGVAGVAVRVQKSREFRVVVVEGRIHRLGCDDDGQWQVTAGEPLRKADEIRPDACLFAGEERARATEPDCDLVRDQEYAVAVAGLAQHCEVGGVVHAHRARTLHQRFDDHGCDLVRLSRERSFHLGEHPPAV